MSGGNFRLRRPVQISAVSGSAKLWIMQDYNVMRYGTQGDSSGCFALLGFVDDFPKCFCSHF
jgi:hypothetical protein